MGTRTRLGAVTEHSTSQLLRRINELVIRWHRLCTPRNPHASAPPQHMQAFLLLSTSKDSSSAHRLRIPPTAAPHVRTCTQTHATASTCSTSTCKHSSSSAHASTPPPQHMQALLLPAHASTPPRGQLVVLCVFACLCVCRTVPMRRFCPYASLLSASTTQREGQNKT